MTKNVKLDGHHLEDVIKFGSSYSLQDHAIRLAISQIEELMSFAKGLGKDHIPNLYSKCHAMSILAYIYSSVPQEAKKPVLTPDQNNGIYIDWKRENKHLRIACPSEKKYEVYTYFNFEKEERLFYGLNVNIMIECLTKFLQ